jgi:cation transporter-like permease
MRKKTEFMKSTGFKVRVSLTVLIWGGWLVFLLLYLFFGGPGVWEALGVMIISIVVGIVLTALLWVSWGLKFAAEHADWECGMDEGAKRHIDEYIDKRIEERLKKK